MKKGGNFYLTDKQISIIYESLDRYYNYNLETATTKKYYEVRREIKILHHKLLKGR